MINTVRVLATDELKDMLETEEDRYAVETEFFSEKKGNLVEKIACTQPDAVIMNLFMPGADAVEIIKAYRLLYADSNTFFVVIVPFMTATLKKELDECGAGRAITKPYCKRHFLTILDELAQLKATPLATLKSVGINTVHTLHHNRKSAAARSNEKPEYEIDAVFDALGMNKSDLGCVFLRRALMIALEGDGNCFEITKCVYPVVAAEFGTTPSCVERRIRGAISEAWRSERSAVITSYFGYTVDNMRGRPTNSEFIAALSDRIKLDMEMMHTRKNLV